MNAVRTAQVASGPLGSLTAATRSTLLGICALGGTWFLPRGPEPRSEIPSGSWQVYMPGMIEKDGISSSSPETLNVIDTFSSISSPS